MKIFITALYFRLKPKEECKEVPQEVSTSYLSEFLISSFFLGTYGCCDIFRAFVGYRGIFMALVSYKTDAQVCVRVTEGIEIEKRPVIKLWCFSPRFPRYISSCFCLRDAIV